jgi:hypothetical protein
MKILEVYPFGEGLGQAFRKNGHDVFVVDFKDRPKYQVTSAVVVPDGPDGLDGWSPPRERWDLVLLRPFCTTYSRASAFMHYRDLHNGHALTEPARRGDRIVCSMMRIATDAKPRYGWVLENPHALLAKCAFMHDVPVVTVTLCQYGAKFRKATDLFGSVPSTFVPKACKMGADCHAHSQWVDKKGQTWGTSVTNGPHPGREFDHQTAFERAFLPYRLSADLERAFRQVSGSPNATESTYGDLT